MSPDRRVVVDTNVIISGILLPRSAPGRALTTIVRHTYPLVSGDTFRELHEKLLLPKFDRYVSVSSRQAFLKRFLAVAAFIPVSTTLEACRDPKDNKFLELALDGEADWIVSGDRDLLVLHPFRGIPVLTPQAFLTAYDPDTAADGPA